MAAPGLSCSMWDLVPLPGIEPGPLHWELRVLTTGPSGKPLKDFFKGKKTINIYPWVALVVKNPPANAGDIRDTGSILGSGRSPAGGHGNLLQYSCLENPMDRRAWWATGHRVTQSQTQLSDLACVQGKVYDLSL